MTDNPIPPPVDVDALLDSLDFDNADVQSYLGDKGWHQEGDCPSCLDDHCGNDCSCADPAPLLGVHTESDQVGLARSFEQLHKLAHPDQSAHIALCKSEPCRSLPWAVVNEIAKVA